jgi:rSAM/selenodomain-associated transferase 1
MTAPTDTPIVVAMLKAPRTGFVKTRLAAEVGAEAAATIYRRLVEHQIAAIPREWRAEVHFAPAEAAAEMQQWLGSVRELHPQQGDDLGERLVHATASVFSRGAGAVIVIGGDCPGLTEDGLRAASRKLASVDVVLGPAADGGYYLIAFRRAQPELFRDIPWSTGVVLTKTLERARAAGLSVALLPTQEDVDDLPSWRRVQSLLSRDVVGVVPRVHSEP